VSGPDLSVVVVAYYGFGPMRQLMRYLAAQTIRDRIEIVIVGTSRAGIDLDEQALDGFFGFQLVEVGPIAALNRARVDGILAARAPIVALTEDHCFPAPDWAEALLAAHEGDWAGVGPTVGLANPQRYQAWANYLLQYGPWIQPTRGGEITDLPGHNSSYKRDVLLSFGDELPELFMADTILHWELRKRGYRLFLETRAQAYHVYMTRLAPFIAENYCIGRQFASTRARDWSWPHRISFALGAPLIPLVRFTRIFRRMREFGWVRDLVPGVLPALAIGLSVSAAGEFMGCLFGLGGAARRTLDLDFSRDRFVSDEERAAIWGEALVVFGPVLPTSQFR
jgi:Glycosyl transferase family 2